MLRHLFRGALVALHYALGSAYLYLEQPERAETELWLALITQVGATHPSNGTLPAHVVDATSKRYLEAYRRVTGSELKI